MRDAMIPYSWDASLIATTSGVQVDCGGYDVQFLMDDGSALNTATFTDTRDTLTTTHEFQINEVSDTSLPGTYAVKY